MASGARLLPRPLCLLLSVADCVFFFSGAFEDEAALLEDVNGSGEMWEGVGEDCFYIAGRFDPCKHGFCCFDSVAVQTERGEDGVSDLSGFWVVGPAEAADGTDEGGRLVVDGAEEDVAVPADVGGVFGEALL